MDDDLCGCCHEHPRHGRAWICIHCFRDNAHRSAETKALRGIASPLRLMRGRRAPVLRCRDCGDVVDRAHATYHALKAHGRVIPVESIDRAFAAVAS